MIEIRRGISPDDLNRIKGTIAAIAHNFLLDELEMIQSRAVINMEVVDEYAEAMTDAGRYCFPSVEVITDGREFWMWDGCHRLLALRKSAVEDRILATVHWGTRRDAVLRAAGANPTHGLRRTNDDKRRSVKFLLDDPEWSQWSNREIARRCNVTEGLVRKMRPADCVQNAVTYTTRHGTEATMNTENIGKSDTQEDRFCSDCGIRIEPPKVICSDCYAKRIAQQSEAAKQRIAAKREAEEKPLGFPPVCPVWDREHIAVHIDGLCSPDHCQWLYRNQYGRRCTHPDRVDPITTFQPFDFDDDNIPNSPTLYCDTCGAFWPQNDAKTCPNCGGSHIELLNGDKIPDLSIDDLGDYEIDDENEFETEAALIRDEDNEPADQTFYCRDCGQVEVKYPGQQCPDCIAAMNAREQARLELRSRAAASLGVALAHDNPNAWRLLSGNVMPLLGGVDVSEMRRAIAGKMLNAHLGIDWSAQPDAVAAFFVDHNIALLPSLADLRNRLDKFREWSAQSSITDAQRRGNLDNITDQVSLAEQLLKGGVISYQDFEDFGNETVALKIQIRKNGEES